VTSEDRLESLERLSLSTSANQLRHSCEPAYLVGEAEERPEAVAVDGPQQGEELEAVVRVVLEVLRDHLT
jgi:hypothetical protein